jgi:Predicted membrane protein (DUF2207) C-terminal domain/Predicted membrane protein (DUF2207) N-terminal domain
VLDWQTEIYLGGEDEFTVSERIVWDFEGAVRHGILRDIPVAYGRGRAADYRIGLDDVEVSDASGTPRPFRTQRSGSLLQIRIGDPDRTVSGVEEYRIRYRVRRGLLFFEDHDELYWNAIGHEVSVPIARAGATVYLPEGATPTSVEHACFTGRLGSVEQACRVTPGVAALGFRAERNLGAGEGLSVVIGLPKGLVREPSRSERWLARARDYLSAWALLPLGVLGVMIGLWRSQGRDPAGAPALPVRYEPPEGLSPAEVGVVLDERVDLVDISATLLDLAVRGYLRIEEVEGQGFLFLRKRDWRLVKLREDDALRPHEALLLGRLFATGDQVLVSSLENRFYAQLPAIKQAIDRAVSRAGRFFPTSPHQVRRRYAGAGLAGLLGGGAALWADASASAAIAIALSGGLVLLFSRAMPRRTARGRAVYEEILGFREFVARVDKDRLERLGGRSLERFERVLPYALVLGAADAWAGAFDGLYTSPPSWYVGRSGGAFHPRSFVDDLGQSLGTIGSAMSSAPRGGSGSSGLGGGGFSGGGMGGGGASSW